MKFKLASFSVALFALLALNTVAVAADAYLRFPAVRGNTVVFTSEGDLWKSTLEGGQAQRLTTHTSPETNAAISPDGQMLAFSAFYEGTQEAYVMPISGGLPKRISFENGVVRVLGWSPQGEVLVAMQNATGPNTYPVVASIQWQNLKQRVFPVAEANDAALDDTGRFLYFTRFGLQLSGDNARQYRGGLKAQIWRFDLQGKAEAVAVLSAADANFRRPMWSQGRLYFISDKTGADNIWSATPEGKDLKALTRHTAWDVRTAAIDGKQVVYQLGADLRVLDLATASDKRLPVSLLSDFDQQRVRQIKSPMEQFSDVDVAWKDERIAITARGRVTLPGLNDKRRMDIAIPAGVRARNAVFGPDDKWIYAIADTTGENEVWRYAADGSARAEQLTKGATTLRWAVYPSPDGKWIAHTDKRGRLWLLDLATRSESLIDDAGGDGVEKHDSVVWAPDSKSIALVREVTWDERKLMAVYHLESKKLAFVSGQRFSSYAPAFSPDGRWLYFLSERNFEVGNRAPWGDRNMGPIFDRRTAVFALALQPGNRFPFKSDDEFTSTPPLPPKPAASAPVSPPATAASTPKSAASAPTADTAKKPDEPKLPAIVMDGLAQRLFEVPLPAGKYTDLAVDAKRLYVLEADQAVAGKASLKTLATEKNGPKPETFVDNVRSFALSGDGKRVFYRTFAMQGSGDFYLVDAGAKQQADISKQKFKLDDWYISFDPRAEWKQMVQDVWRLQRDYLFDHTMRGVDWTAMRTKYFPLVDRVSDRDELNDVLAMMTAELGALHSQIVPGDVRRAPPEGVPSNLGALLERVANGYRIERIFQGVRELPSDRGPLAQPDVDVRVGDVITAVNGRSVNDVRHISDLLLNQAGLQTRLDLMRGEKTLAVIVKPVAQARHQVLRYSDWEQERAERVDTASKGRIGYLHLRAMGPPDIATFAREFYSNLAKDGLVIDVRRNQGGSIDSWIIEKLLRKNWAYWTGTHGAPGAINMQGTFRGHLIVLTDELTYSDGETFAAGIKELGIAPVVGKTTAGAGVWLGDGTKLSDNGRARTAESAQFLTSTNQWIVEGVGVTPDVEVDNPPHATFMGQDLQLETAIKMLQKKIADSPVKKLAPGKMTPMALEPK